MSVPKEAVHIVIYEAPKSNLATDGKLHSEKICVFPKRINSMKVNYSY